jgi:hypothetical protein
MTGPQFSPAADRGALSRRVWSNAEDGIVDLLSVAYMQTAHRDTAGCELPPTDASGY